MFGLAVVCEIWFARKKSLSKHREYLFVKMPLSSLILVYRYLQKTSVLFQTNLSFFLCDNIDTPYSLVISSLFNLSSHKNYSIYTSDEVKIIIYK